MPLPSSLTEATVVLSRIAVEHFFQPLVQRKHQIAIRAGKKAGKHFDHGHARAQRGVDRAKFESDVSAADDQQGFREYLRDSARRWNPSCAACRASGWERSPDASRSR